jgi:hypothetical protein
LEYLVSGAVLESLWGRLFATPRIFAYLCSWRTWQKVRQVLYARCLNIVVIDSEKLVSWENPTAFLRGAFDEGIDEEAISACAALKVGSVHRRDTTIEVDARA